MQVHLNQQLNKIKKQLNKNKRLQKNKHNKLHKKQCNKFKIKVKN